MIVNNKHTESCPWAYGDAVYGARSLFAKFDPARIFDGNYCGTATQPLMQAIDTPTGVTMNLYPNPTDSYLLVEVNAELRKEKPLTITDALGRQYAVLLEQGEGNVWWIDTQKLQPGLYFITASTNAGQEVSLTFVKK